ncbi:MAG: type II toxin-antitoxin system RelE/ParE family toxin [Acidiferrobacterales bacterium]
MIKSFRHKGLEQFFTTGNKSGIQSNHAERLNDILFRLQFSVQPQDLNFPGSGLHPLKGKLKGFWAIKVSGNWRVVFKFNEGHALEVDYVDYH